jgi:hypothetical protein
MCRTIPYLQDVSKYSVPHVLLLALRTVLRIEVKERLLFRTEIPRSEHASFRVQRVGARTQDGGLGTESGENSNLHNQNTGLYIPII